MMLLQWDYNSLQQFSADSYALFVLLILLLIPLFIYTCTYELAGCVGF